MWHSIFDIFCAIPNTKINALYLLQRVSKLLNHVLFLGACRLPRTQNPMQQSSPGYLLICHLPPTIFPTVAYRVYPLAQIMAMLTSISTIEE
jgi:hypothetical protein